MKTISRWCAIVLIMSTPTLVAGAQTSQDSVSMIVAAVSAVRGQLPAGRTSITVLKDPSLAQRVASHVGYQARDRMAPDSTVQVGFEVSTATHTLRGGSVRLSSWQKRPSGRWHLLDWLILLNREGNAWIATKVSVEAES